MTSAVIPIFENKKSWCHPPDGCGADMSLIQPSVSYLKSDQTSGDAVLLDIDIDAGEITLFVQGEKRVELLHHFRAVVFKDPLLDTQVNVDQESRFYEFIFDDGEVFTSRAIAVVECEGLLHVFRTAKDNIYRVLVPSLNIDIYRQKQEHLPIDAAQVQVLGGVLNTRAQLDEVLRRGLHPTGKGIMEQLLSNSVISTAVYQAMKEGVLRDKSDAQAVSYLLEVGSYSEKDIQFARAQTLAIPFVDVDKVEADERAISLIDENTARKLNVFPLMFFRDSVVVAMLNPADYSLMTQLRFLMGRNIEPVMTSHRSLRSAINRVYSPLASDDIFVEAQSNDESKPEEHISDEVDGGDRPTVKLVASILSEAIEKKASDIHIRPQEKHVDLIFRINGALISVRRFSRAALSGIVSRIKIIGKMNVAEHRLPQDGRTHLLHSGKAVDLRISILPSVYGESVVLRILDTSAGMKGIDEIGFSEEDQVRFKHLINRSSGMILVTGPTGSGKSTTLYSALHEVMKRDVNVITVEDPVEYHMSGALQVQVQQKIGMHFARVLRQILRHDPDVIMVGEIRDQETATIAAESALTGHLVLSTLHTNSASLTISRLLEMGIEPYMINSSLAAVLAQRLVRTNCPHCIEDYIPEEELCSLMGVAAGETYKQGVGCSECMNTGVMGRRAVYELLQLEPTMKKLIISEPNPVDLESQARQDGMRPLTEHALLLAKEGVISLEEAYRVRLE